MCAKALKNRRWREIWILKGAYYAGYALRVKGRIAKESKKPLSMTESGSFAQLMD
ncbi:MAG: hypothetical protein R3207_13475 [Oceanospirillum sp.]|nr:hypothetical protein [Oceanospirillum sp.]